MRNFGDYQLQLYLQGMLQGPRPEITTDLARLESQAAGTLSAESTLAGQAGVEHVLRCLLAELDLTLALSGYADHRELNRDSVVRA
jgi:lactate 2-monooxygenase